MQSGYWLQFLDGTWITIKLALVSLLFGLLLGFLGAAGKLSPIRWLNHGVGAIANVIRSIPELLVIFFIYYGSTIILSSLFGTYIEVSAFTAGVTALALIFGAYASETIRGAYLAIPHGQVEAAMACGLSKWQTFSRIMVPQLWFHALPGLGNLWFVLLKDTALVALIGLPDLMRTATNVSAATQQPFSMYGIAALVYLSLTSLSLLAQRQLQQRTSRYIAPEE